MTKSPKSAQWFKCYGKQSISMLEILAAILANGDHRKFRCISKSSCFFYDDNKK